LNANENGSGISDVGEVGMNSNDIVDADGNRIRSVVVDLIMTTMPDPERRGYFLHRRNRP